MAASVQQTMRSINDTCRARGGKYAEYSCKVVSWDDVSRGEVDGALSCWGANITDTYLKSKDGTQLFTVRSDNWNEKLGRIASDELALVAGNHVPSGDVAPMALRDFLKELGTFGSYAGLADLTDMSNDDLDKQCSIRFQTTFLPVSGARGTLEFATEAYNYNTTSDEDPRNLVLLCTSQGVAVQQDGAGTKKMFHHDVDHDGNIHRYWLEAERSDHKVGGSQKETAAERADALARGKAIAKVIGTKAMGSRFNVLMTIQVPLQQKKPPPEEIFDEAECFKGGAMPMAACAAMPEMEACSLDMAEDECGMMEMDDVRSCASAASSPKRMKKGTANAARVSRGTEFDVWSGLSMVEPERNATEHVTITVVMYNTVADGVPSEEDVIAAIDDLESLYEATAARGQLADATFDFMKKDLTQQDMSEIQEKLTTQPPQPSSQEASTAQPQQPSSQEASKQKKSCLIS